MAKKECFSELIDHSHGKYTLFGRVLADTPDDPARQNVRSADIAIPTGLEIGDYVVSATFVTEDPNDANHRSRSFRARVRAIPIAMGSPSWPRDDGKMQIQANMSANTS
jgi:hypothetical protein